MPDIKARGKLGDHDIEASVVNPGDWYGRVWLIEVGCGYSSVFYAVEADSVSDAIDEFSGSQWGHHILVEDKDLDDYPEDSRYYNDGGQVCDLDHIHVHGREVPHMSRDLSPWPCTYVGEGLPDEGVASTIYSEFIEWVEADPRRKE